MLNKLKKTWYADDFSYFIRNFGIFTLIFSAMTLIIIQVMRSSLYTTVDNNLKSLSQDSASVINLALARRVGLEQKSDNEEPKADTGLLINQMSVLIRKLSYLIRITSRLLLAIIFWDLTNFPLIASNWIAFGKFK